METKELLIKLSAPDGVSGMEGAAADVAVELLSKYGAVGRTALGSVICTVREPKSGEPHIMLDAHLDEIGMIVTCMEDGFLRVGNCGGVDRRVLSAARVTVHTREGALPGVVSSVPPHLQGAEEKKNPKVEELLIDVGLSKEECERRVRPGDRVTVRSYPAELLGGLVCGKALDDRAGCAALLKALDALGGAPGCGLSVVFSTMEEVGGQGAGTAAYQLRPTHAIVVDVSYAHTLDAPRARCGLMGKGPMIGVAPALSRVLSDRLIALAKEREIPYQLEAMGGKTGTNADGIAVSRAGVRTALVSIPLKYMHTPVEVVDPADVDWTGRLIAALIADIAGRNA